MISKTDFNHFAADAMTNPKIVASVSTATTGIGVSTYLEWISRGVGIAASTAGFFLAVMMVRKVMLESAKLKLEIDKLTGGCEDAKEKAN